MSETPQAYRARLIALQRAQRARLIALTSEAEQRLDAEWHTIPARIRHLYAPVLDSYARDLAALRAEEGDPYARLTPAWLTQQSARLHAIERAITSAVNDYASGAAQTVTHAQATAAPMGATHAGDLLTTALAPGAQAAGVPVGVLWNRPNPQAVAQLVGRASDGGPLGRLFSGFGPEAATAARRALTLGLATGQGPASIARDLMQALGISRNRALTIARTETLGAYRSAASLNYRANRGVLDGWLWSADKSARTCAACLAMDGTQHTVDETLDSHACCRCAQIPVTKSWSDILSPLGVDDTSDIPETSMGADGAYQSGADWLADQPEDTQRAVIGTQAGYDAYANGDVSLMDFVGVSHDPRWGTSRYQKSLKQLGIKP